MTEISFHTGVPDLLVHACRLLRKGFKSGARIAVCADDEALRALDRALWTAEPGDFTPHVLLARGAKPAPRLAPTPIWLLHGLQDSPVHEVLVNLGREPVPGFESFERVVEIVAGDAEAAQAGRRRWRHYAERGYAIRHHAIG